jgi:hypothetical protein
MNRSPVLYLIQTFYAKDVSDVDTGLFLWNQALPKLV